MKRFINIITSGFIAFVALTGVAATVSLATDSPVYAAANTDDAQKGVNAIGGNEPGNRAGAFTNLLAAIINILLFIIGAIAVIMIIIGGIRYTTSNGDQAQVTSAKNTILYAIVGLVVAIMAFAIVNFVLASLNR
jgi:hypothetical protein